VAISALDRGPDWGITGVDVVILGVSELEGLDVALLS
jgi:hypothetical protein